MHYLHLDILLPLAIFLYFLFCMTRKGSRVVVNWPVLGMLPTIIANHNRLLDKITDILTEFNYTKMFTGPWLTGPHFLLSCDPEIANHIFNLNFANYPKGKDYSEMFFDVLGDGLFNSDGEPWEAQRKLAQVHFGQRTFRNFAGMCTKEKVDGVLLPLLTDMAKHGKVVDLSDVCMRFVADTTCRLVLGVDPGSLAADFPNVAFAHALDEAEQVLLFRHIVPKVWWKLLKALRMGKERKMAEQLELMNSFVEQCIRERRRQRQESQRTSGHDQLQAAHLDIVAPYMEAGYDDKFLRDIVVTFLAAGKDTLGSALGWFFWLVSRNPDVEEKIVKELKELVHRRSKSINHSTAAGLTRFDIDETDALVYLHAALCETLRLYPPLPINHKEAVKADIFPSGLQVSAGTHIYFCNYSLGRMEGIWGKDCLDFRPERWITEKGALRHEPPFKFIVFHLGPRTCLGKGIGFTQMKFVAAAVLYNFEVKVLDGYVVEPKPSIVLQLKNGLLARLKKREAN